MKSFSDACVAAVWVGRLSAAGVDVVRWALPLLLIWRAGLLPNGYEAWLLAPLAAIAATPLANSISPTGFISAGPCARYIDSHSR